MVNPAYLYGIAATTIFFLASTSQAYSETDHERVVILEKRVAELEVLLKAQPAGKGIARAKKQKANTSQQSNEAPQPASAPQPAASSEASASANAATPKKSLADQPSDAPQELFVLRENSVTLKPTTFEVDVGAGYASRRGQIQSDRGVIGVGSIRYGVFDWLELSATVPFGWTLRATNISVDRQVVKSLAGLGDSSVQGNFKLFEQTRDYPGAVLSLGAILPTGRSPYNFAGYALNSPGSAATPNPNDIFKDYFSRSAWGAHTNLQFYKTVDPIIVFFGIGADYLFSDRFQSHTVQEGIRYNYNMGVSFALSEKSTIGFSLNGSYNSTLKVDGRKVPQSATEPVLATVSLIERVAKNLFLEPSIAFGLNEDSPNFVLGLGVRARF